MIERQQYCTFVLHDGLFGVEVERVQEIIPHQVMTDIPHAPRAVAGLINLRGDIVPAIDLRRCLELPERDGDALPINVVIRTGDGAVSLIVDEIGDVLEVSDQSYEPPPENLRDGMRQLIRGIFKLGDGLLMVLSTEAAITAATEAIDDC